jgi:pimeloyl-ACP methyl ester carboxylesterase
MFYFHRTPGSRLEHHPDDAIARERGARIITADRPGFGHSDFQPHRTFLDWPEDVVQLADALQVECFAVCGWSNGTPHAAACAYKIPERLTNVCLFSGVTPFDVPGVLHGMETGVRLQLGLAKYLPWRVVKEVWTPIAWSFRHRLDSTYKEFLHVLDDAERAEFGQPEVRSMLSASMMESYRQGGDGEAWEDRLVTGAWDFRLQDIELEVYTWHGTADTLTPPDMGRALADALPHRHITWCEGEGHGLWFKHWPEMLDVLLRPADTSLGADTH